MLYCVQYLVNIHKIICLGIFKQGILLSKAYLSDVTAVSSFTEAMGSFASSVTAGAAIGVVIGGHLATFDPTFLTSAIAITVTFSFLTIFMFFVPSQNQISLNSKSKTPSFANIPILVFRYWDVLLLRLAQQLAEIVYYTNLILFLEDQFLFSLSEAGYILAFNSVCAIIAARATNMILKNIYNNNNILLILHFTFLCASGYLMLLFLDVSILFFAFFLIESSSMIFRLSHLNLIMSRTSSEDRGVSIGIITAIGSVAKIIAPGLSGYLYELDYRYPMVASCCLCLSSLFVLVIVSKKAGYRSEDTQVTNLN